MSPPTMTPRAVPFIFERCFLAEISGPTVARSLPRLASACRLFDFHHAMNKREDIAAKD